jgi:hypothetical protein
MRDSIGHASGQINSPSGVRRLAAALDFQYVSRTVRSQITQRHLKFKAIPVRRVRTPTDEIRNLQRDV